MTKRIAIFTLLTLMLLSFAAPALAEEPPETPSPYLPCDIRVPEGREATAAYLIDGNDRTRFTLTARQSITVTWKGEASGVLLCWYDALNQVTISLFNERDELLSSNKYMETEYRMFVPAPNARKMIITSTMGTPDVSLCELRVCEPGYTPLYQKNGKVDLMLILSAVSDELDLMGGLLPMYVGEHGIRTAIVYVGRDFGYQVQEAFRAFETMGIDVIPLFMQKDDNATCSILALPRYWRESMLREQLLDLIQKYDPQVVVTCDPEDTISPPRTPYTAQVVTKVVQVAGLTKKIHVKKMYQLSEKGETIVDWRTPLVSYGGRSACEVAQDAYQSYGSKASFRAVIPEESRFSLVYSIVGEDTGEGDLFEHVKTDTLIRYLSPTPTPIPTPTPTPTATPTPTEAPTKTPISTSTPGATGEAAATESIASPVAREENATSEPGLSKGILSLFVVSGALVLAAMFFLKKKRTTAIVLLVLAGLVAFVASTLLKNGQVMEEALEKAALSGDALETPDPTATAKPTAKPTPTATLEPTASPVPTPTPDPNEGFFRQEGEPEEVVLSDYAAGHWEYRSDILSVVIDRRLTKKDNKPYVAYVAHVRMRQVNSFRSLVSTHAAIVTAAEPPWRLARNYKAVLAVTGDNLNEADIDYKGILIRNGIYYCERPREDTLVFEDDLTMRIIPGGSVSGVDLMDSGVVNAFSFGPTLVKDGQVNPDVVKHRVYRENPRCGVGMVEPGHFVVIVTDGRDEERAYGHKMDAFAQLFVDEGVTVAYNMDGGSSAAMVFMGEHVNWHSDDPQRTWADALAWGYSRLVPGVTDPVRYNGRKRTY